MTKPGEVVLNPNQFALLQGLLDRPHARAESTADLARAAVPHVRAMGERVVLARLREVAARLHPAWVDREQRARGSKVTWRLTRRGRAIAEGNVPLAIRRGGRVQPIREFRDGRASRTELEEIRGQWRESLGVPELATITAAAEAMVRAWERQHPADTFGTRREWLAARDQLELVVKSTVLHAVALPSGTRELAPGLTVRFNDLRPLGWYATDDVALERHGAHSAFIPRTDAGVELLKRLADDRRMWTGQTLICRTADAAAVVEALEREVE